MILFPTCPLLSTCLLNARTDTSPASQDAVVPYDVIAVIGASHSTQSKAVSHVLGPAKVPLISVFSTSDELSDKSQFPFFLRIVPPDR